MLLRRHVSKLLRFGIYFLFLLLLRSQFNCAARGIPGGGPPDQIPPQVINTFPAADSTGIKKINKIEFVFSERMDDASVNQSIFISPVLKYTLHWSGWDKLFLKISDTLRSNITYVVTIGSAAKDQQRNRMKESFQLAFATGTHIDHAKISGKVYGISRQENFYVYGYKYTAQDTINPTIRLADYLSQPGEDGLFLLNYLSPGTYRVFVVEDVNKNLLLDLNFERIGIPYRDVNLDSSSSVAEDLNFTITRLDTTPPLISGARALNNRTVLLRCSESLRSLSSDQILICDSLKTDTLRIKALSPNKDDRKQYYLYTVTQPEKSKYFLTVKALVDSVGNFQKDTQQASFTTSALIDTTHFRMLKISPPDSAGKLPLASSISIEFSVPVDTLSILAAFSIVDNQQKKVAGNWQWADLKKGFFTVSGGFKPSTQYRFEIRTRDFRSVWGDTLADTTISRTIFIISADELGSLSGRYLSEKPLPHTVFLDILSLRERKKVKRVRVNADNTFQADMLMEGLYQLSGFIDLNEDGEYSAGTLFPFHFAEPFYMQTDTIRVRKRWETENIQFTIPGVQ
jgi:hypothetical protein